MSDINTAESFSSIQEKQIEEYDKDTTSMDTNNEFYQTKKDEPVELDSATRSKNLSEINPLIIKNANRTIRLKTTKNEYEKLLSERNNLVDKKFTDSLTKKEERRLGLLRWEIEGIEDAKAGPQLDRLEKMVEIRKNFTKDLSNFLNDIKTVRT